MSRGVFTYKAWVRIFGFQDEGEPIGLDARHVYPSEEEYARVGRILYPKLETGVTTEVDAILQRKDGSVFDGHIRMRAINPSDPSHGTIAAISDITQRKRMEEELRISEEKFSKAFFLSPDAIMISRLVDGMIVSVNEGFKQILGYTEEELIGKTTLEFNLWDNPEDRNRLIEGLKTEGRVDNLEFRSRTKDGKIRYALMSASIIVLNGVEHILNITRDITERKRAEEALRGSQERLELALKGADLGFWDLDLTTGQGVVNQRMVEIIGYSPGEVETSLEVWQQFIHPDDIGFVREDLNDHFQGRTDFVDHEYRIRTKSVQHVWVLARGRVVQRGEDGRPLRMAGTVMDVTDRKKAEEALKESEVKYRMLTENMDDVIWQTTPDMILTYVSPSDKRQRGYEAHEVLGKPVWHFFTPDSMENLKTRITERVTYVLSERKALEPVTYEIEQILKDGTTLWTEVRGNWIFDDEGQPISIQGVTRDLTDRKRAEQEKENLRAQLLQSQKMETMGTLAGGIAHDFNNMLAVILGFSDMLLADKNEGDPGYEELRKIVKTSEDAADLVQRIRIFGRKAEMNLIPLDLNHQVDEATKLLSRTLPKMIEMDIHLTKDPVVIKADSSQIAQMVMNLAVNAGEAMPQGGRLSILTENIVLDDDYCRPHVGVKPGPHVMLTVSDTGRGIDKGLMERIFDPFYSTKMRDYHKGTGLGLSVVQGIVQQHGGHITVESEVGKGTIFRMYFPALEVEILPEYVEWEIPYPAGGTETILLVEDWETVRELGVTILEKFGYTVLSAGDGQEALEVYEKEQGNISLVILDILMPRMDGKECLVELLRINPAVKVIISSGVGYYDLINDIVKIGAKGAVNKPYSMRQLLGMVRDVLDED